MKRLALLAPLFVLFGSAIAAPTLAQQSFVSIGTGGVTGVYYAASEDADG